MLIDKQLRDLSSYHFATGHGRPAMDGLVRALQALPHLTRRSITFDRGTEFTATDHGCRIQAARLTCISFRYSDSDACRLTASARSTAEHKSRKCQSVPRILVHFRFVRAIA